MAIYLKKFETTSQYNAYTASTEFITPNVSICTTEGDVHYNPYVPPYDGFCKLILNNGETVELESSGELTSAMTSAYSATVVSAEIGTQCTSIGKSTFEFCSGLTSIDIPDSVTSIGDNAFYRCSGLTSVIIPDRVTSIGHGAFTDCYSLTSIDIPDSVTIFGNSAFSSCSGLTSCTIGNSVTSIGVSAFYNCSSLTSVVIPDSVTSINTTSFYGCTSLTSVTVKATTPPTLGSYVFDNTNNCKIYVPSDKVNAYKTASRWSTYADRIQAIP